MTIQDTRRSLERARRKLRSWMLRKPMVALFVVIVTLTGLFLVVDRFMTDPVVSMPSGAGTARGSRWSSLEDAIFGGLVASLTAYSLVQFFVIQKRSVSAKKWLKFNQSPVRIVVTCLEHKTGEGSPPTPYFVVPPFDAQAAGFLIEIARRAGYSYPHRRTSGSHYVDERILHENVVTMCLPNKNQYTRIFLGLYHDLLEKKVSPREIRSKEHWRRYEKDRECALEYYGLKREESSDGSRKWRVLDHRDSEENRWKTSSMNEYGPEIVNEPGKTFNDFCIVVKGPNPLNPEAGILIVSGIHGIGTLGGAIWVYQNADDLFLDFAGEPQAHLLRVRYSIPTGRTHYVDAEIVTPILHQSWALLDRRYFVHETPSSPAEGPTVEREVAPEREPDPRDVL